MIHPAVGARKAITPPAGRAGSETGAATLPAAVLLEGGLERPIERVEVAAYRIPTDRTESDGTLEWCSTTLVVARVFARS